MRGPNFYYLNHGGYMALLAYAAGLALTAGIMRLTARGSDGFLARAAFGTSWLMWHVGFALSVTVNLRTIWQEPREIMNLGGASFILPLSLVLFSVALQVPAWFETAIKEERGTLEPARLEPRARVFGIYRTVGGWLSILVATVLGTWAGLRYAF